MNSRYESTVNQATSDSAEIVSSYVPHAGFTISPELYGQLNRRLACYSDKNIALESIYNNGGKINPFNPDIFIQQLKDEGANELVRQIQKQLDSWRIENGK